MVKGKKLSLKNCQAIERGYDLDEEISNIVKTIVPDDRGDDVWFGTSMAVGKLCFQKALELIGDKKYSEKKMLEFGEYVWKHGGRERSMIQLLRDYNAHLQTEWDVVIVEEKVYDGLDEMAQPQYVKQLKLDADSGLILKRINSETDL